MTQSPPSSKKNLLSSLPVAFLAALQFLTIFPLIILRSFTEKELGRATIFFPLIGLLLGAILAATAWLLAKLFPPLVWAVLTLTVWILLTGALHLDGFLDTCDGLFGGYTPESRLEIMRDERLGAYAFACGALLLLLKFAALASLHNPAAALLLAPTLGRWTMAWAITAFPYARSSGIGHTMKDHSNWSLAGAATLFTVAAGWLIAGWWGLGAMASVALTTWAGARFALRRVPGLTGDIYGALNEIAEAVILLIFVVRQAL